MKFKYEKTQNGYPEWNNNPQIVSLNMNKPHSDFVSYETKEQAIKRAFDNSVKEKQATPIKANNRESLNALIKEQIDVDLDKAATERQAHPRSYLNIDSRKLSKNELNSLMYYANKNDINIQSNGVYDYAITYKK